MKSGIYIITNIYTKRFYIGSAVNIIKRFNNHKSDLRKNRHPNKKLQNGYNKYSLDGFNFEILEYCTVDDLITREQFYIDTLKPWYNLKQIADSSLGIKLSESTKLKIGVNNGRFWLGKKLPEEMKQKMRKPNSDITKSRKSLYAKNRSSTHKNNLRLASIIPVEVFKIDGEYIGKFDSLSTASKITGVHTSKISQVCKQKRRKANGFIFRYA